MESYQQRSGGAIFAPGLGASSPLGNLKWREISPALAAAKTHDDAASDLSKQAEKEYRDRDVTMPKVTQALRDARDVLLVANRENPKALGDFGYVVDDSPQAKPKPRPKASACLAEVMRAARKTGRR